MLLAEQVAGFGGVQPEQWRGRDCWNLYYRIWPQLWGRGIATERAGLHRQPAAPDDQYAVLLSGPAPA